jgi:hypothetical protein
METGSPVESDVNPNELREQLKKMSDRQLGDFGRALEYLVSPRATMGQAPHGCS